MGSSSRKVVLCMSVKEYSVIVTWSCAEEVCMPWLCMSSSRAAMILVMSSGVASGT